MISAGRCVKVHLGRLDPSGGFANFASMPATGPSPLPPAFLGALRIALPADAVLAGQEDLDHYGHDETEDLRFPPAIVVRARNTAEVSATVRLCAEFQVPVTPIGGRTGLSGGALSVQAGVGLALDRMDRIIHIDERNLQVTVEPGVITQRLMDAVAERGLYYACDPSSKGSCTLGGNIAENAGGPRAVKYGVTRDQVLNLEVVLPGGEVIWTGANTLKNSTGYDLTRLMVGSEGTLGVITKAVLRLVPLPKETRLMLVPFADAENACAAVSAVFQAGIMPSALEFMERDAIAWTMRFTDGLPSQLSTDPGAYLLIEVDGGAYTQGRHTRGKGFEEDCVKLSTAAALGYRVVRVTGTHIRSGEAVHLIAQALSTTPAAPEGE